MIGKCGTQTNCSPSTLSTPDNHYYLDVPYSSVTASELCDMPDQPASYNIPCPVSVFLF
jgi:hypothetical protein